MAAPRTTKPRPIAADLKVDLNLDTYERESGPAKPFVAVVGGKAISFTDPQEIPWQDLMGLDDPEDFARLCVAEGDREHFLDTPLPTWKMNLLMDGFKAHYGLGSPGNVDA